MNSKRLKQKTDNEPVQERKQDEIVIDKKSASSSESSDSENESTDKSKEKVKKGGKGKNVKKDLAEFDFGDDDDALSYNVNDDIAKNTIISIAPGQFNKPLPWLVTPNIEELCFPRIYAGQKFNTNKVSNTKATKSKIKRADRRACGPEPVFYMSRRKTEMQLFTNMNVALRKVKGSNPNAGDVLNEDKINEMIQHDDGYRFMKGMPRTPSYWEDVSKKNTRILSSIGSPDLFYDIECSRETMV